MREENKEMGLSARCTLCLGGERAIWKARVDSIHEFEMCLQPENLDIAKGDMVVMGTRYGRDLARILGPMEEKEEIASDRLRTIYRIATERDFAHRKELDLKGQDAFRICREKIEELDLKMKLVSAHYMLDDQKLLFFFTADNRIDFRELVKRLVAQFRLRIELRQIGVRDEARVVGGMAVCGRQYCCHKVTDKLAPVSIKMAKEQNLSLNSQKLSGPCSRLLCCLAYEHDHYTREKRSMPRTGSRIEYDGEIYKVMEVNVFKSVIQLSGSEGRVLEIPSSRLARQSNGIWEIQPETEAEQDLDLAVNGNI